MSLVNANSYIFFRNNFSLRDVSLTFCDHFELFNPVTTGLRDSKEKCIFLISLHGFYFQVNKCKTKGILGCNIRECIETALCFESGQNRKQTNHSRVVFVSTVIEVSYRRIPP
jgi:hypothetical protein